jgi:hypothetical protein
MSKDQFRATTKLVCCVAIGGLIGHITGNPAFGWLAGIITILVVIIKTEE